jgi:hypothetical protein
MDKLTIGKILSLEPRLSDLLHDARLGENKPDYCADDYWYKQIKPRLVKLVGWYADSDNEILSTSEAYDMTYQFFYSALPDCRHENPQHLAL